MSTLSFSVEKSVNIFKYTDTKLLDGKTFIIGHEYNHTKEFALHLLKMFIERDIFLYKKQGLIPKCVCKFEYGKRDWLDLLKITVLNLESKEDSFDETTVPSQRKILIRNHISQILWKYNRVEIDASDNAIRRRFFFSIEFNDLRPPSSQMIKAA